MDKESKPNEEQDWKAQLFERLDNIERNNERRFELMEMRMNNLEAKFEQSTEWVKAKVSQSMLATGAALDDHILHAEAKYNDLQISIEQVEKRVVESLGILTGDIIACRETQERHNAEQSVRMDGIDEDLHGFRRVQDIEDTIPEIDDKVNAAVEGMLSNVQFINHNIANDVMSLGARVAELDERFTTMQQLERFQPEYIKLMMERLEGRISTVDMDQRNIAHGLMEAGQSITNWENFLRREIREVAEDVSNLQEIVADRSGPIPLAERNINIGNVPVNDNPPDIPWYAEETMGNSTLMQDSFIREVRGVEAQPRREAEGYTLLRGEIVTAPRHRGTESRSSHRQEERKSNRPAAEKKRKVRGDDGDPPSGSSSSDSSTSGSNADDADRSRKSRKKDEDSDDDDSSSTHRHGVFKFTALGGANKNRRESIIADENSTSASSHDDHGGRSHSNSKIIYVQPEPKMDDFKLKEIRIGTVLHFCKAFNNASSQFRGRLNAVNFIEDNLLRQMKQVAYKEGMAGAEGILKNGRQRIKNEEIFAILAIMCAPTNTHKMQLELSKSCWPKRSEYKAIEDVAKNIANFRVDLLTYVDRFDEKLVLFKCHRKSRKLIPRDVFKKGGGDPGLADYFIGGLPDRNLGLRIWASVSSKKRAKCRTFEKFKKYFIMAVEAMEGREEDRDVNKQICFGVREMMKNEKSKSPSHFKSKEWVTQRGQSSQRVHNIEDMAAVVSDAESNEEIEIVFSRDDEEHEELPSAIQEFEEKDENSIITEEDVSELANLLQPADSKQQGICYDMLYKGKCEKVNCPYSHKAEDIEKAKKLRALRLSTQPKSGPKQVSFNRSTYPAQRKT